LLGAVAGAAPLFLIDILALVLTGQDAFGYGDMKLMLVAGIFLGWKLSLTALLFGILAGGLIFAVLLGLKMVERKGYVAFGPFLALGILLSLWFGEDFLGFLFVG
jgi:leader peptidase (prepilin peptidase)/N-methyltransferase